MSPCVTKVKSSCPRTHIFPYKIFVFEGIREVFRELVTGRRSCFGLQIVERLAQLSCSRAVLQG